MMMVKRNRLLSILSLVLALNIIYSGALSALVEESPSLTKARKAMVEVQLKGRDITDEKVLRVMENLPRHRFVSKDLENVAYSDHPLPIGEGQTISQPYIVALMTQCLRLKGDEKALEIGTGSGYQAAVLAELLPEVYTVEIREGLGKKAKTLLENLGYKNIKIKIADGYFGWKEHAPYDAIVVTCAVDHFPPPLLEQLKEGGRMVIPVGSPYSYQSLMLVEKKEGQIYSTHITGCLFVPMVRAGKGWRERRKK